ncbi:MAG: TraX family protein [Acholeplasmataceae bacterium]
MNRMELKILALITMTIDHIGVFLIPNTSEFYLYFRMIGRLAFPIFAFMIAEGYYHTKSKKHYFLRLLSLAIVFEAVLYLIYLIYGYNMTHIPFTENRVALVNIMWTLILGFLGLYVIDHYHKKGSLLLIPLIVLSYFSSYSFYGFGIILAFGLLKDMRKKELAFIFLTILYSLMPLLIPQGGFRGINYVQLFAITSIVFIHEYNGLMGKYKLRFFYLYYPIHIVVLFLISYYI